MNAILDIDGAANANDNDSPDIGALISDAALLASARSYLSAETELRRMNAMSAAGDVRPDKYWEPAHDQYFKSLKEVANTPATTPLGIRAKAEVLAAEIRLNTLDDPASSDARLAISLAQDLLGRDLSEYIA